MNSLFFLFLFRFGFAQISYSQIPACSTVEGPQGDQSFIHLPVCADVQNTYSGAELPKSQAVAFAGCPGVTFDFPRDNQETDYVRYRSYFPALNEGTICFWVNTSDYTSEFTGILSYSVSGSHNEILFGFENGVDILFYLKDHVFRFHVAPYLSSSQQVMLHICGKFSTRSREVSLYINSVRVSLQTYSLGAIRGGGTLILGQEQDYTLARRLDSNQAYRGSISNVMVWPRVLSDVEIRRVAKDCDCPSDYSAAMTMDRVELQGSASYLVEPECLKL